MDKVTSTRQYVLRPHSSRIGQDLSKTLYGTEAGSEFHAAVLRLHT